MFFCAWSVLKADYTVILSSKGYYITVETTEVKHIQDLG